MSMLRTDVAARMKAIAGLGAGTPIVLGVALMCVGAFLAFPLVFSLLFWVIGFRLTLWAVLVFVGGLTLEVIGFGLILVGPRIWSRVLRRGRD